MKTKGLLDLLVEAVNAAPGEIAETVQYLAVCLWIGHDLKEVPRKKWIWDPNRKCKRCGALVTINFKDREPNQKPVGQGKKSDA